MPDTKTGGGSCEFCPDLKPGAPRCAQCGRRAIEEILDWEYLTSAVAGDPTATIGFQLPGGRRSSTRLETDQRFSGLFRELSCRRNYEDGVWFDDRPTVVEFLTWAVEWIESREGTDDADEGLHNTRKFLEVAKDFLGAREAGRQARSALALADANAGIRPTGGAFVCRRGGPPPPADGAPTWTYIRQEPDPERPDQPIDTPLSSRDEAIAFGEIAIRNKRLAVVIARLRTIRERGPAGSTFAVSRRMCAKPTGRHSRTRRSRRSRGRSSGSRKTRSNGTHTIDGPEGTRMAEDQKTYNAVVKVDVRVYAGYGVTIAKTEVQESVPIAGPLESLAAGGLKDVRKAIRPAADGVAAELWAAILETHGEAVAPVRAARAAMDQADRKNAEYGNYRADISVDVLQVDSDRYSDKPLTLVKHDAGEGGQLEKIVFPVPASAVSDHADTLLDLVVGLVESTFGRRVNGAAPRDVGECPRENCCGRVMQNADDYPPTCDECGGAAVLAAVRAEAFDEEDN